MSSYRAALLVGALALGGSLLHQLPHLIGGLKRPLVEEAPTIVRGAGEHVAPKVLRRESESLALRTPLPRRVESLPPLIAADSVSSHSQASEVLVSLSNAPAANETDVNRWLVAIKQSSASQPLKAAIATSISGSDQPSLLAKQVAREPIVLVDGIPRDASQYSSVFGSATPSVVQEGAIRAAQDRLDNLVLAGAQRIGPPLLVNSFQRKEKIIVFVAHNVGGEIALPDGTKYLLRDISDRCETMRKMCVFLSCDAYKYVGDARTAARRRLSVNEAADAVGLLVKLLDSMPPNATYSDLVETIPAVLLAAQIRAGGRKTAKFTIVAAAPSGAIWVAVEYESAPA